MPNHITNRLVIKASDELKAKILSDIAGIDKQGKEMPIDFNKICPMPKTLEIEAGSTTFDGLLLAKEEAGIALSEDEISSLARVKEKGEDYNTKCLSLGRIALENYNKYGHADWYSWRISHWDTKWNAYEQHVEGDEIWFETAWSMPYDIYLTLSERYPEAVFEVTYADEDISYNCGKVDFQNGEEIYSERPVGGSVEAYDICFELDMICREDYELKDGKYQYIEEEDE